MISNIRDILIISKERDSPFYKELLGDGSELGLFFTYKVQEKPKGIAEAFIIGEDFIGKNSVCLIIGDNVFYEQGFLLILHKVANIDDGACVFAYYVNNPEQFDVIEFKM